MKKIILLVLLFAFLLMPMLAKSVTINEISKPSMMVVEDNKLYILEKTTIFIYSLKDFKLIKKFGRAGEGPQEFMARTFGPPMSMSFVNEKLVVNSINKLSYFTKDGKFISERKTFANLVLYQVKDNFIAAGPSLDKDKIMRISLRLFSKDLKEVKTLFHSNISIYYRNNFLLPTTAITYNASYKDKIIVVASNEDFVIDIFNYKGEKIRRINKKYKKIKHTDKDKNFVKDWFKNRSQFKRFYDKIKQTIKFKTNFPAIRDINISDDKIYVITHKRKNDLWECIVLDMYGKELNKTFIPLNDYIPYTFYAIMYSVENGKLYSLLEDADEEIWKLHVTKVN